MIDKYKVSRFLDSIEVRTTDSVRYKKYARRISNAVWVIIRFFLMSGLSFVLLYPILYMLSMAFRPTGEVFDPSIIWVPKTFTFINFSKVLESMNYFEAVTQTVSVCILSSLLLIVSSCLTGYGFARFKFRGQKILFAILILTIIVPPQVTLIPLYLHNSRFDFFLLRPAIGFVTRLFIGKEITLPVANLLDTPWSFYLPALFGNGIRSGLLIYIYCQFFKGLPKELEDAAYIDGAGMFQTFLRVIVPNATPAVLTVFLFSIVWYWNDYFYSAFFLSTNQTVSVSLAKLRAYLVTTNAFNTDPFQYITQLQAGCLLTILPPLVCYIIFQKYFTESIERTGIVG